MDRLWEQAPTPFNALVQETKAARDMQRAANVPVAPWFAPRDFDVSDPGKVPNATSHMFGSAMWQEMVIHNILSTGARELLWWKPGHMKPSNVGVALLSGVLSELEQLLNDDLGAGTIADAGVGAGAASTQKIVLKPSISVVTDVADWNVPYLVSGVSVGVVGGASNSADAGGGAIISADAARVTSRTLYRFTPRCLQDGTIATSACTMWPLPLRNGTRAKFRIGSGFELMPVPNGTLLVPTNATAAPAGFWIVA
jgi:hypothetical protein